MASQILLEVRYNLLLFNSLQYVAFLPIVFAIYWMVPNKYRKWLLLMASYYFYMSWNVKYVVLILFTTVVSYLAGVFLQKTENHRVKKCIAVGAALLCIAVLFVFKYFEFAMESIESIARLFTIQINPLVLNLILPVGISFYTFQTLSYVIDVYRGDEKAEKDFIVYATFVSFFPQLVAGPIERTSNLLPQIKALHCFNEDKAVEGAKLMIWGYYKKLVIADNISGYVDTVYGNLASYHGFDIALAVFFFTIQIYCDFSGYSDIAIGTAKLLDIDLVTNFKSPYFAASVKEFWSRWHISLSTWFRDYVYIPLGGNRCPTVRYYFNLLITFLVSGLWHGASWNFVIWGGIHGIAQIVENIFDKVLMKVRNHKFGRFICVGAVFIFCNLAWVFFRTENFSDAIYVINNIFIGISNPIGYLHSQLMSIPKFMSLLGFIFILTIYDYWDYTQGIDNYLKKHSMLFRWLAYIGIGVLIMLCSQKGVAAEFVYFQF